MQKIRVQTQIQMPRKKMFKFNIDKLKVCYRHPQGLYDYYAQYLGDQTFHYDGYDLHLMPFTEGSPICLNVIVGGVLLGTLSINREKPQPQEEETTTSSNSLCWFMFHNRALYEVLTSDPTTQTKSNLIGVWDEIAHDIGLELHNLTEMEIALDSNFSLSAPLRKMIKNYQRFEMFMNGNKIADPNAKIADYHETFGRSRKRLLGTPTLYFDQARKDSPLLRMYHKSKEIKDKENEKDYINEWNDFGSKAETYRAEVRLKSNSLREFLNKYTPPIDYPTTLQIIQSQHFLFSAWNYFTDKLIFFRDTDGNDIHLADFLLQ